MKLTPPDPSDLYWAHLPDGQVLGERCGKTWGEMAPAGNRQGVMHWCTRAPQPGLTGSPGAHQGRHRCGCGEYVDQGAACRVVCSFPADGDETRVCNATVDGVTREVTTIPASLRLGRKAVKVSIVRSKPCGHVVRRGF